MILPTKKHTVSPLAASGDDADRFHSKTDLLWSRKTKSSGLWPTWSKAGSTFWSVKFLTHSSCLSSRVTNMKGGCSGSPEKHVLLTYSLSKTNRLTLPFQKSRLLQIRNFELCLLAFFVSHRSSQTSQGNPAGIVRAFLLLLMDEINQSFVQNVKNPHIKPCSWST